MGYFLDRRRKNPDKVHRDLDFLKQHEAAGAYATYAKHVALLPAHCSLWADVIETARSFGDRGKEDPENLVKAAILFASAGHSEWHSFREMLYRLLADDSTKHLAVNAVLMARPFMEHRNFFEAVGVLESRGLNLEATLFYKSMMPLPGSNEQPSPDVEQAYGHAVGRVFASFIDIARPINPSIPVPDGESIFIGGYVPGSMLPFDYLINAGTNLFSNRFDVAGMQGAICAPFLKKPFVVPSLEDLKKFAGHIEWMKFLGAYVGLPQSIKQILHLAHILRGNLDSRNDPSFAPQKSAAKEFEAGLEFTYFEALILSGNIPGGFSFLDAIGP